ncbi:MAG: DnaJ-domain-containing protein 1 [Bradymonadia bacterium]|jgi:DnaJ-domain-containing protein 1
MGIRDRLRDGLNKIQEQVIEFDEAGGVSAFAERSRDWAKEQEDKFIAGEHQFNPEHRTKVRLWYARLDLPPGAQADEVRRAFRGLMRKYHPDRYTANPEHEALATELSQSLTISYNGLLAYLGEK